MRRVRYAVATSPDGYLAGPCGETDWITTDPDLDFGAIFRQFDTVFMGRRTFETTRRSSAGMLPGMNAYVFSRTLQPRDYPNITVVSENPQETVAALRTRPGKDIWLFGGGTLFRSLAEAKLVDSVEITVMPILLGGGVPLLPAPANRIPLQLLQQKVYTSGIVHLEYATARAQ